MYQICYISDYTLRFILFIVEVEIIMDEIFESQAFCNGVAVGINLYQQKVIMAHENNEAIKINGELYYIQSGKERLQEMIDKMCK